MKGGLSERSRSYVDGGLFLSHVSVIIKTFALVEFITYVSLRSLASSLIDRTLIVATFKLTVDSQALI